MTNSLYSSWQTVHFWRRAGDRNTILDQLKELDLPQPIELDVSGEPK